MVLDHLIPDYEIQSRLASGGVAEVFRAIRVKDGQEVALKVMSLNDIDPEFQPEERFKRECSILERLNHPSLPRLYGYGVTDSGLGWLAIELVSGQPLSGYIGRPPIDLIPVFIQIAEGLAAVAQEGIVHRDISPDNILVEELRGRLRARLIDFGVAKDLLAGEAGGLTRHGAFIGKLAYASPEQLVGLPKGQTIDFRSDVYSLGHTMFECLAGKRAIEGDSLPELVDAHLKGQLPPLVIPPENGGPATRLVWLVQRMVAKKREDRPGSWEEIVAELWRSREEVAPLSETLARKRGLPGDSSGTTTVARLPAPPDVRHELEREVLFGRIVLGVGAVAFIASVVFAVHFLRTSGKDALPVDPTPVATPTPLVSRTPEVVVAPVVVAAEATPRAAAPKKTPRPTSTPRASRPTPTAVAAKGTLEVSLLPAGTVGELEDVADESGRSLVRRRSLPARLDLPPGVYKVRLSGKAPDCVKNLTVTVQSGKVAAVRTSCIEIK